MLVNQKSAPTAFKKNYEYTIHNTKIIDPYFWLRDKNWPKVQDPEILNYLKEENDYFNSYLDKYKNLTDQIFEELKGRIKLADQTVPIKKDDYFYYQRTEEDKNYPIFCRKLKDGPEEIILDQNRLAENKSFLSLGAYAVSPDHKLLAFSIDDNGSERYTLKLFNIEAKEYLQDSITNVGSSIIWHEKLQGFFYTVLDENWRSNKVFFHKLGDDSKNDRLIYFEEDHLYRVSISKSSSKQYLFINVSGHELNEYHFIDMDDEEVSCNLFNKRRDMHFYDVDHNDGYFYIHTNNKTKDFRIARCPIDSKDYSESFWENYVDDIPGSYLVSFDLTQAYLILNYRNNGLPLIKVRDIKAGSEKTVSFPDAVYSASAYSTNFIEDDIRINYSSLKRADTTYSYSFTDNKLNILKEKEIPSGFNPNDYHAERLWADNNGVKIPISVLYKTSLFKKDASNPLYLYAYGSYGITINPTFRSSILSLVDRGFVFAIAHVRGGDDMGFEWYQDAKFLKKKNTFEDYIKCAEHLIANKYTSSGNIIVSGGSAGGLLVGAVINMRPEIFKAAIAHVPFVDVLATMLDESLPLTPGEFKEWGNPKESEYFEYMKSYSPYDNIKPQVYPHIFVTAGLSDPRVGYWEAAKWVAKLREMKEGDNIIIMRTNMDAGHQGSSGRFDYLKEIAEEYGFILNLFQSK